jgi:hypothetical protein
MLDPTISFVLFSIAIPVVMFVLKLLADRYEWELSGDGRLVLAAALSLGAVGLQLWLVGSLPVFEGTPLEVLKTAVAFFTVQMSLYEVVFKRVWALFA